MQAKIIDIRDEIKYENIEDISMYNLVGKVGKDVLVNAVKIMNNIFDIMDIYDLTIMMFSYVWWAIIINER